MINTTSSVVPKPTLQRWAAGGIGTANTDFGHCRNPIFHKSIFGTSGYERKPLSDVANMPDRVGLDNLGGYRHAVGGADNVHHNRRSRRSRIRVHGLLIFRSRERLQEQAWTSPHSGCERNERSSQNTPDDPNTANASAANDALPAIDAPSPMSGCGAYALNPVFVNKNKPPEPQSNVSFKSTTKTEDFESD